MSKPPPPRIVPKQGVADGWVSLGVIARAHGLKGGLKLHLWNGTQSAALAAGAEVRVGDRLLRVRAFGNGILALHGVDDRTAADALCSVEVCARRADFPDTGDLYLVDLIGAPVAHVAGHALGTARGFTSNGAQELLVVAVSGDGDDVLVPFVAPLVISASAAGIVLNPPGGLFDDDAIDAEDAPGPRLSVVRGDGTRDDDVGSEDDEGVDA